MLRALRYNQGIPLQSYEVEMEDVIQKLQDELRGIPLAEGRNETGIPCTAAWRFTSKNIQMPKTENPYLYIVLDGMLRLHTPSGMMDYVAGQYSLSKIDTPLSGTVLAFSDRQDFLALSIEFAVHDVVTAVLGLDNDLTEKILVGHMGERAMSLADQAVVQAVYRLFSAMNRPVPSEFLRKSLMQEVIYYLLCGSCGKPFLQSIAGITEAEEIYEANSWIKENFRSPFTVEELAGQRNMSVSLFHQKFKSAVGMGPLQCQKRLRLTEARRLMLDEDKNVTRASGEVGYESLSQFIRDYRKMFGRAPKEDILAIRGLLKK